MASSLTNLPPELISSILAHLRPRALRQCLLVNSAFNVLAQHMLMMHASGYVVVDQHGVSFPLIKGVPEQQNSLVPENISCLTVTEHYNCYKKGRLPFASSAGLPLVSSCRVLRIILNSPDVEDNITGSHYTEFSNPLDPDDFDEGVDVEGKYICVHFVYCQVLHFALEEATVDKLILRNVPLVHGNVDPDFLAPSVSQTIREAVIVFDPEAASYSNNERLEDWDQFWHDGLICKQGFGLLDYPVIGDIACSVPPNVEELTFVFWTDRPTKEVAPACCCVTKSWDGYEDRFLVRNVKHTSCWEEDFWPTLAAAMVPLLLHKLRQITIVNARGIVPTGAQRRPVISAIWAGVGTHDALESKFRVLLFAHLSSEPGVTPERARDCVDRVKFTYMNDWLLSTDSEDVFSRKEVKPWLEFKP
ncbi:hypothetical protein A1Q2_00908 [Trichosporon asahii var. asahii CBS 8904]|uniref:F-box domain-containing protein n=1 Tax=Trichosporon asahii var. asahii (strain CBS 8904) TaxID=1220162 RepID=K1VZ07_TRIAC|nr:hypothetical protein A1Q2_00908 [Trichosporon asahii var. asahii CBS 8904]